MHSKMIKTKNHRYFFLAILCQLLTKINFITADDTSQLESECCYGQSLVYRKYVEFVGKRSETRLGNTCMNWDSEELPNRKRKWLENKFKVKRNYLSRQINNNYCRSLRKGKKPGCYVSPNKWENCDIPRCAETLLDEKGIYYKGKTNRAQNSKLCLPWSDTDEVGHLRDSKHNFCRNPNSDPNGPWCFTGENSEKSYCSSLTICKMRVAKLVDAKLTVLPKQKKITKKPKKKIKQKSPSPKNSENSRKVTKPKETWEPPCGKICKCGMRCSSNQGISACAFVKNDGQVERGEEPWHVAIVNKATKQLICSGSILNRRHILTAASCVTAFKNAMIQKANRINKKQILVATGFHRRGPFVGDIESGKNVRKRFM